MKNFPQGIFQTLDWLTKQVSKLSTNTYPVYNIGFIANGTTYTITKAGIYVCESTGTGNIKFPDPALFKGKTIMLFPLGAASVILINSTNAPYAGGAVKTSTASGETNIFFSNGVFWAGGGVF